MRHEVVGDLTYLVALCHSKCIIYQPLLPQAAKGIVRGLPPEYGLFIFHHEGLLASQHLIQDTGKGPHLSNAAIHHDPLLSILCALKLQLQGAQHWWGCIGGGGTWRLHILDALCL